MHTFTTTGESAPPDQAETPLSGDALRARIEGLCVPDVLNVAVQPVVRLADLQIVGYEALTRVPVHPRHSPDWWFERAGELQLRARLEIAAWRAIAARGAPPDDTLLFVNASPALLSEPDLLALRSELPGRIVIEVTEQEAVADYMRLRGDLAPWLSGGARLAIDDTGAGYSSLRHVIELSPDFLKIDRSLVTSVHRDHSRRALVRSLVAFAREVGCTVIAEGVETAAELEALRDAEVDLAQGYLLGRPGRPWPAARRPLHRLASGFHPEHELARLGLKLSRATDAHSACEAAVEYLYRRGDMMPSIYLERGDQLRCISQRGLWQVLDGLGPISGITGRTWSSGTPMFVTDVSSSPEYLEAIPGVRSEICVPISGEGRTIGALNVESVGPLGRETLLLLEQCARLLAKRLSIVGWGGRITSWQGAAQASVTISELTLDGDPALHTLGALCAAGELDSGALITDEQGELSVRCATGPLASVLEQLPSDELGRLSLLVEEMSSCYTASGATGRGFVGTEALRAFARAVVVLPLRSGGRRTGTVVLASSTPRALTGEEVEPLELLAAHYAATLSASAFVAQLRRQAREDHLTGIGNRTAFDQLLDGRPTRQSGTRLAAIFDIDHFKKINDERGHLVGDEVLQVLAAELRNEFEPFELFRYGGDEFALFCEDCSSEEGRQLITSLCEVARAVLEHYGTSLTAGVAFGNSDEAPRILFARADEALLWGKRHARGDAVFASALDKIA